MALITGTTILFSGKLVFQYSGLEGNMGIYLSLSYMVGIKNKI